MHIYAPYITYIIRYQSEQNIKARISEVTMKKLIIFLLIIRLTNVFSSSAVGEIPDNCIGTSTQHTLTTPYNWYFRKTIDHTQPSLDALFHFTKDCDAYFIDNNHTDYSSDDKVIYLTFDAGYENGNVKKTLDILKENNVPGAFFVLENLIKKNPDLIKRMNDEGHLVCNHTATHKDMSKVTSEDDFCTELERLNKVCLEETGVKIAPYYRPPEGRFSELNLRHATKAGYKTIFWSFAYVDWEENKQPSHEDAMDKIINNLHNGEIMLLHATSKTNSEIMDDMIKKIYEEGYEIKSIEDFVR